MNSTSRKKGITLKQIAEQAKVSQSMVSLILNGKGRASEKVRNRVLNLLEEAGYRPKYSRKPFYYLVDLPGIERAGKTRNVLEQLSGMQHRFNSLDLELRISFLDTDQNSRTGNVPEQLQNLAGSKPGGVIVSTDAQYLDQACVVFSKNRIPIVQAGYDTENPNYSAVVSDSFASVYTATRYLINKGHKKIGLLRWMAGLAELNSSKKFAGYQAALAESGITCHEKYVVSVTSVQGDAGWTPARYQVKKMMNLDEPPGALVVENSYIGLSLIYPLASDDGKLPDWLRSLEIVQCEDWALQPAHDIISEKLFYPEMETMLVCIDWERIGKSAAELLIDHSANPVSVPHILRVNPSLFRVHGKNRELAK